MATVKMGMTIEEAAECSGIGRNTMRKLVEWRKLPVLKVGRKTIIRSDTLARRCGLGQSAQRRTALNRPCAPLSLHAPADTAGGRTEA